MAGKQDYTSYEERAARIAASFSYSGFQIARRELFAHRMVPAMTIRTDSIAFNQACINGLEDAVYIHIMISQEKKQIAIRRCEENEKDALRWCVAKPDKRKSREINGEDFPKMVYKLMDWDKHCRYKLTGYKIDYQNDTLYVFELSEPEIFHVMPKRTKEEIEELKSSMTEEEYKEMRKKEMAAARKPFYPDDVENTFGVPVEQHENTIRLDDPGSFQQVSQMTQKAGGTGERKE